MAEIVRMPKLSDTMTEGVVAKWHKKVGDTIKSGELLADIETDKATMEVPSPVAGEIIEVIAKIGDELKTGDLVAKIRVSVAPTEPVRAIQEIEQWTISSRFWRGSTPRSPSASLPAARRSVRARRSAP